MSILYVLKPQKDRALRSICSILRSLGLTPNMVTASGLLLSVVASMAAMSGHLYAGIFLFITGACFDALDGSLARYSGHCTEFGRYFDSICDRLSEIVFIVGAVAGGVSISAFLVIGGSLALLASRIYNHAKGLHSNAAMFGRPERLTLLILGLVSPTPYGTLFFMLAGILCAISSLQVLVSGIRTHKPSESKKLLIGN